MKRQSDFDGLQFLFTGLVAIGLALHVIGVFVYRLYTQRADQIETIEHDQTKGSDE